MCRYLEEGDGRDYLAHNTHARTWHNFRPGRMNTMRRISPQIPFTIGPLLTTTTKLFLVRVQMERRMRLNRGFVRRPKYASLEMCRVQLVESEDDHIIRWLHPDMRCNAWALWYALWFCFW